MSQYNFEGAVEDHMIITGGHFTLSRDASSINPGTLLSFRYATELYSRKKGAHRNLALGLLINDIGAVCSATSCQTISVPKREEFIFPDAYLSLLDEYGVDPQEVIIFWERHIRNRSKKLLHSQLSQNNPAICYKEKEGFFYKSPDTEIVLTRSNEGDKRGTPACPLIMSAYSLEHRRMGYTSSLNFYYVGEDNYMNVANYFVIEKGRFLATQFSPDLGSIKNVYVFEDKIVKNF